MANLNKVMLIGRMTRDPEARSSKAGMKIASFGMAINRISGKGDDKKEETTFVDITAFSRLAEIIVLGTNGDNKKGNDPWAK